MTRFSDHQTSLLSAAPVTPRAPAQTSPGRVGGCGLFCLLLATAIMLAALPVALSWAWVEKYTSEDITRRSLDWYLDVDELCELISPISS